MDAKHRAKFEANALGNFFVRHKPVVTDMEWIHCYETKQQSMPKKYASVCRSHFSYPRQTGEAPL